MAIAVQAFHVAQRTTPPRLVPLLDKVRTHCPLLTTARGLADHFTETVFGDEPLLP